MGESLGADEMEVGDAAVGHEHQKTYAIRLSRERITRRWRNRTWHAAHPLGPELGEEQSLHPPPVSPALHPCTPSVLPSIEDVFRIVKGDDDGGFCVGRQG